MSNEIQCFEQPRRFAVIKRAFKSFLEGKRSANLQFSRFLHISRNLTGLLIGGALVEDVNLTRIKKFYNVEWGGSTLIEKNNKASGDI
jgi:hypothetical protein